MREVRTIAFETEAKRLYLLAKEILYIQAEGHNCHVYTISGNCYVIRLTMTQCARIIDESTYSKSSNFVLLGRNLIINYSRLDKCVFNDAEIPLRKATTKNGREEVVAVKCQTQAWKLFFNLLEQGDAALAQYQASKRQEYKSVNQPPSCSLIGFMTTAAVAKPDFYNLKNQKDFLLLGGCDVNPIYSEGTMDYELEEIANWANKTVVSINETIRRQPTKLVDRAFRANGDPKFDITFSYEEYWKVSTVVKPSVRLKALQKKFNELYDANLQKIIADSEDKKNDDKRKIESFERLGMNKMMLAMDRIIKELSEQGDHPSCYRSRPLGLYRYKGRNHRPEIVLFLKNIYDAERSWHCGYYDKRLPTLNELVTLTYIHELMHAVMHSKTNYAFIEEPLAEMGMLCFVHDALYDDPNLEEKALYWVKQKQGYEPICHYGYGAFLYESLNNAEVGWGVGNLMKQYIRANKKLSEKEAALDDYEEYFLGGYPLNNLQRSALDKLFVALGINRIKKIIPESIGPLFEWHKNNQTQITVTQSRVENDEVDTKDEECFLGGFLSRYEEEVVDYDIFSPHRKNWMFDAIAKNIKQYEVNLGLNTIDSYSYALQRESSRYCQDIYIDYLLKILNDKNSWKKLFGSIDTTDFVDLIVSIELTRTSVGDLYQYNLKIGL